MLVSEKITRRIDNYGRVSLPKNLRSKFEMSEGSEVEFFTLYENDKAYLCIGLKENSTDEKDK